MVPSLYIVSLVKCKEPPNIPFPLTQSNDPHLYPIR